MTYSKIIKPFRLRWIAILILIVIFLLIILYRPIILTFHARVIPHGNKLEGFVFRYNRKNFLVRLNTGSDLIVNFEKNKLIFLTRKRGAGGFRIGDYLICSLRRFKGVDMSHTESFGEQKIEVVNNLVRLKDPITQDGEFSFPLNLNVAIPDRE